MPNSYTKLVYHIVFGTKNREQLINPDRQDDLYAYIGGIIRNESCQLLAAGGVADHVHLLVATKPTNALSSLLMKIKANSSRWISETHGSEFAWQEGYGAFTVSESQISTVRRYIANQREHHLKLSFRDKFALLLERHGIEFDAEYLP